MPRSAHRWKHEYPPSRKGHTARAPSDTVAQRQPHPDAVARNTTLETSRWSARALVRSVWLLKWVYAGFIPCIWNQVLDMVCEPCTQACCSPCIEPALMRACGRWIATTSTFEYRAFPRLANPPGGSTETCEMPITPLLDSLLLTILLRTSSSVPQ